MNKTATHIIRARLALLLLAVFASSLLIKPIHLLTAHHHELSLVQENAVSGERHESCSICDFEFCQFIPQQKTSVPQAICVVYTQQTAHTVTCLIRQSSHLFQLRAPPAC